MSADLVLRSRRVITPTGAGPATIVVRDGQIVEVTGASLPNAEDVGDLVIMPGLVDSHVHINEPGRTEWEGFTTATHAAAAGGVTTLVDMPLNSIPATTTVAGLQEKLAAAREQCWVDVGFWGGIVPGNVDQLEPLVEAGVLGFKCFLLPSGVPEFEAVQLTDLPAALEVLRSLDVPLLAHAEFAEPILAATDDVKSTGADPNAYASFLRSRPPASEYAAIAALLQVSALIDARVHIVHLASGEAVPMVREARERGWRVTVETCPHYLYFAAEDIPDGATEYKCTPPIREAPNREALWDGLAQGVIDLVVSDHSPAPADLKAGDFFQAWGGIASLQLRLPIVWAGANARGYDLQQITRWLCAAPAELAGLKNKGSIEAGRDADFVIWDPDAQWTVEPNLLHHRHKQTPYQGATLPGVVRATYLRGTQIFDGKTVHEPATGMLLVRSK